MHLVATATEGVQAAAMQSAPFGPGFSEDVAGEADKMEVWGTSFNDPGPDYCLFKLFNGEELLGEKRVEGY